MLSTWGFGKDGRLGNGSEKNLTQPVPLPFFAGQYLQEVACGGQFSLVKTDSGKVYAWGCGINGECGTGHSETLTQPREIKFREGWIVKNIFAGYQQAAAITSTNTLLVWGTIESIGTIFSPTKVKTLSGVVSVGCGGYHTVAATNNGRVYTVGVGWDGRIGHGEDLTDSFIFKPIQGFTLDVVEISCGWDHTMLLSRKGEVYTWGRGSYGQLGHGNFEKYYVPSLIHALSNLKIVQIAAGGTFSAAVSDDGKLFTWGDDKAGQLGHPYDKSSKGIFGSRTAKQQNKLLRSSPRQVMFFEERDICVRQVACGSQHMLALTDDRSVYIWGNFLSSVKSKSIPPVRVDINSALSVYSGLYHCIALHDPIQTNARASSIQTKEIQPYMELPYHQQYIDKYPILCDLNMEGSTQLLLRLALKSVMTQLRRTNILIVGQTGVGKSAIINAIFRASLAEVGTGVPVTKSITKFSRSDLPVNIYDTVGITFNPEEEKDIIKQLKEILFHPITQDDIIHVVWYVVDCSLARFTPFESKLCQQVLQKVPMAFIMNKADLIAPRDLETLQGVLQNQGLSNCIGIFCGYAKDGIYTESLVQDISECPMCTSTGINVNKKRQKFYCDDCGESGRLPLLANQLKSLVLASFKALPSQVQESFSTAQQLMEHFKEQTSTEIIQQYHYLDTKKKNVDPVFEVAETLAKLTLLWAFKDHEDIFSFQNSPTWLSLLVSTLKYMQEKNTKSSGTSITILWNYCLRKYNLALQQGEKDPLQYAFKSFTKTVLDNVAHVLEQQGLESLLNTFGEEMDLSASASVQLDIFIDHCKKYASSTSLLGEEKKEKEKEQVGVVLDAGKPPIKVLDVVMQEMDQNEILRVVNEAVEAADKEMVVVEVVDEKVEVVEVAKEKKEKGEKGEM
eukprot:TRINITY_DN10675_c0_g1_i2.p1 TRINITY_DN10675_c0_g1~~TRINITY_DN10675_c0_g1_i2.p1  ORF type:complete len:904 (+),score=220.30 TRINITY_DN10675_c0_g1_i2:834-3545(+)